MFIGRKVATIFAMITCCWKYPVLAILASNFYFIFIFHFNSPLILAHFFASLFASATVLKKAIAASYSRRYTFFSSG